MMDIDQDKVDQAVLALLYLGRHESSRIWNTLTGRFLKDLGLGSRGSTALTRGQMPPPNHLSTSDCTRHASQ
jgi:hypothetical protein